MQNNRQLINRGKPTNDSNRPTLLPIIICVAILIWFLTFWHSEHQPASSSPSTGSFTSHLPPNDSTIVGTWRLQSGQFTFTYHKYDSCALEFTDYGEYILYAGEHYDEVYYRGSYTLNGQQLTMTVDNMFNMNANVTLNGNNLRLVTSSGTATFLKVNTQAYPYDFDSSTIRSSYERQGYNVEYINLTESDAYTRVYRTCLTNSYRYMDITILQEDRYAYSSIGQHWYLSNSTAIESTETWHVNGLWRCGTKTLYISSFSPSEAVIEYTVPRTVPGTGYTYSGTLNVYRTEDAMRRHEYLGISLPAQYGSGSYGNLYFDKDEGVMNTTVQFNKEVYTYYGN